MLRIDKYHLAQNMFIFLNNKTTCSTDRTSIQKEWKEIHFYFANNNNRRNKTYNCRVFAKIQKKTHANLKHNRKQNPEDCTMTRNKEAEAHVILTWFRKTPSTTMDTSDARSLVDMIYVTVYDARLIYILPCALHI